MPVNPVSPLILAYYNSLESRVGYRLLLGGTRHFGYYFSENSWPWPVSTALRNMEAKMLAALECSPGAKVLDAGCGAGHVALYMAQIGDFHVECIDLTPHHITKAARNIQRSGAGDKVHASVGDYHDLHQFPDNSFDGVYTMETLVHSSAPGVVLREFLRVLKPGGRIVLHEYDHPRPGECPKDWADERRKINEVVGMPGFESFETDGLGKLAIRMGFQDVKSVDMSKHIVPMLWLFYVLAFVPYFVFRLFGFQWDFVNTTSGYAAYTGRKYWRYMQVSGRKPE